MLARVLAIVGLIAVLVTAPALAASADDGDDIEAALEAWTPTDGEWTVTNSEDTEGARRDCAAGRLVQFTNAAGETAGVVWAHCGNHVKAVDVLRATYAPNGMFPAVGIEPAFGEGKELTSPYPAFDGLNRLWTQGNWFVTVSRSCANLDDCDAVTADYARSLAAIIGQPVDDVAPIPHQRNDYFGGWSPTDENGWQLGAANPLLGSDIERCITGASNTWGGTDGSYLQVFWVRCADSATAFALRNEKWAHLTDSEGLALAFGPGLERVSRYTTAGGVEAASRAWVQGDLYVNVERSCPTGGFDQCDRATLQYARQLTKLLPGEVTLDTTLEAATLEGGWLFIVVPIGTFLLLYLPQRIWFWARSRGYSVETDNPDFTAVDGLVRRVRIGRIVRRLLITILALVTWLFLNFATFGLQDPVVVLTIVFLSPFVLFAAYSLLLRLVWKPHPLLAFARRRARPSPLGIVGSLVRATASVLAGLSIVVYFFGSLLLIADRGVTLATIREEVEFAFTPPIYPPYLVLSAIRLVIHVLDASGTYILVFLILLVVPVTLAYLLDRFGQRLARRGLKDTLATDDRPYFLYLRGFDEDRLRIDESVGRKGFLELFTPFGRPRFEEVLVEYLTLYGPVIAIAGGRQVLSDLGAAKISLGNHEWQDKVREWSSGARAVVMSATPREVREGLEWEMEHVAAQAGGVRIMLVLAPWGRAEVARRWAGFLERAGRWPLFAPLVEVPMPPGVEVMTYSPERGWHGYGSRRRWDWSYAASIVTAVDNGDFDAPLPDADLAGTVEA